MERRFQLILLVLFDLVVVDCIADVVDYCDDCIIDCIVAADVVPKNTLLD